jgi:hypothetical protein
MRVNTFLVSRSVMQGIFVSYVVTEIHDLVIQLARNFGILDARR